jgi:hypothetical protein
MQRKEQAEREKEEAVAEAKRQEKLFAERMLQSICIEVKIGKESSVSVQIVWGSTVLQLKQLLSREHMGNADLKAHALVGEGKVSLENSATLLASGVVGGSKLKLVDVVVKRKRKRNQPGAVEGAESRRRTVRRRSRRRIGSFWRKRNCPNPPYAPPLKTLS